MLVPPGGLVGVVSLRRALWGFGGVQDCGWLLGLGVGLALWMAAVVVWFSGSLGWVSVGLCGWLLLWSGCCEGLGLGLVLVCRVQWVVWFAGVGGFGFGLGLGFGVAREC